MTTRGPYKPKVAGGHPKSLGQRIRQIRIAWGWSQVTLAHVLHTDQQVVSDWERDRSAPTGASLGALAALFRLSPEALASGDGFKILDPPGSVMGGSPMSYEQIKELQNAMPELGVGEILQVDTGASESELVELKAAFAAIREAQKQGRQVWVILGDPAKPPSQK